MKIVVRGTNWVGDAIMTIPALRKIKELFPASQVTLCSRSWSQEIFRDADFIDNFLTVEKKRFSVFQQAQIWRQNQFDLAVILTNSFESALLAKLGNVKKSFGYKTEKRSFLLTNSINVPDWKNELHEVFYYLNLVSAIEKEFFGTNKIVQESFQADLPISSEKILKAEDLFKTHNLNLRNKTIALGVGSTNSRAKRWPADYFAQLNDLLQNNLQANVILLGTKDELEISQEVYEKSQRKPLILTGKTSLDEAVAVLAKVDLLISNDMGLAHIAPALKTKTLVIFGPTNWKTTQPLGSEIIRREVECSPCMLRDCPIDHRCMTQISPSEVFHKATSMING